MEQGQEGQADTEPAAGEAPLAEATNDNDAGSGGWQEQGCAAAPRSSVVLPRMAFLPRLRSWLLTSPTT